MARALSVAVATGPGDRLVGLFEAHYDRLYRLARRLAPAADVAEDLVQETFLRAARAIGSVPAGPSAEEAWLVRVLINIQRDEWRKRAVRSRYPASRDPEPVTEGHESAVVARSTVWRALEMLPPRRRAVLVMHELEGLPVKELASQLGISAITARWHLARGRRDLASIIQSGTGVSHDDGSRRAPRR